MTHSHGHHHDHGDAHDHGHHHDHSAHARELASDPNNRRALLIALAIAVVFLIVEIAGGVIANSLALLSDAAHMFTDAAAYAIALFAAWIARRPATDTRTYGLARAEILAALVNGAALIAVSAWLVIEATQRLAHPQHVAGSNVAVVATVGLCANIVIVAVLMRADRSNLNIRGALLHGITDTLSSIYVVCSGFLVAATGIYEIDSGASYVIAALTLWGAWRLVRESVDVLMDAAPSGASAAGVSSVMLEIDGVVQVHDVHVWTLAPRVGALSAHVRVAPGTDQARTLRLITHAIQEHFQITHTTIQITTDRSAATAEAVRLMSVQDAIEWATDHIATTHPELSKSVIGAAAGAAALSYTPDQLVSPVAISVRALGALGKHDDHA